LNKKHWGNKKYT